MDIKRVNENLKKLLLVYKEIYSNATINLFDGDKDKDKEFLATFSIDDIDNLLEVIHCYYNNLYNYSIYFSDWENETPIITISLIGETSERYASKEQVICSLHHLCDCIDSMSRTVEAVKNFLEYETPPEVQWPTDIPYYK